MVVHAGNPSPLKRRIVVNRACLSYRVRPCLKREKKNLGLMSQNCNLSIKEAKAGGSPSSGHFRVHSQSYLKANWLGDTGL